MLFDFLMKTETPKKEASRAEVFSKIAEAKRNGSISTHIDSPISLELNNELQLMGCSAFSGSSGTNIYWKNS